MGKGMLLSGSRVSKRVCAVIAAVAIALGMPAFSVGVGYGVTDESKAAESVAFVDGGFEGVTDTWQMGWSTVAYDSEWTSWPSEFNGNWLTASDEQKRSGSLGLGVWFSIDGYVELTQSITLQKGTYTLSGYAKDDNCKQNKIKFKGDGITGAEVEVSSSNFVEFTGAIEVAEDSKTYNVVVQIEGKEEAYIGLDDITITKTSGDDTTDPQSEAVDKTDLKKLIDTVPADLETASFTSAEAVGEVKAAKSAAEAVYANSSATEADIDGAYTLTSSIITTKHE